MKCLRVCAKCTDLYSSRACAKSHVGIWFPWINSIVSNASVSGQHRPWSDCVGAGLSGPSLSANARRHVFAWRCPFYSVCSAQVYIGITLYICSCLYYYLEKVALMQIDDLSQHQKTYHRTYAPSKYSEQTSHLRNLIRIATGISLDS